MCFHTFSQINNIKKVSSFFTDYICGSECLDNDDNICKCGKDEFDGDQYEKYCCSNATCTKSANGDVTCSNGQILPFSQSCNEECPSRNEDNNMAISSCDNFEGCPSSNRYSKICIKSDQVNFGSFCDFDDYSSEGISCSKALNSKWSFDQCYTSNTDFIR